MTSKSESMQLPRCWNWKEVKRKRFDRSLWPVSKSKNMVSKVPSSSLPLTPLIRDFVDFRFIVLHARRLDWRPIQLFLQIDRRHWEKYNPNQRQTHRLGFEWWNIIGEFIGVDGQRTTFCVLSFTVGIRFLQTFLFDINLGRCNDCST